VALPSSTFDWTICNGVNEIPIEERGSSEITHIHGILENNDPSFVDIAPTGTRCANYGFDVTPARLITGLISERGIMKASEKDILRLYPEKA
jgi:methylthioribose-1-phosphate isomerase